MDNIIEILMRRDGSSRQEAQAQVEEAQRLIELALQAGNMDEIEDIMLEELGLEMDYIHDLI